MAGPSSADIPDRYDVVFSLNDGTTYGFLYADSVESNLPFRTHKALYSYSPTFLERQNVSNTYGDNFQDFFLTGAQADFSEGEQQKFFRVNDPDSVRRYWAGSAIDPLTTPGNTTLAHALASTATSQTFSTACPNSVTQGGTPAWWMADPTNMYSIGSDGTVTTIGAHGCGGSTSGPSAMVVDTAGTIFLAKEGDSSVGIRKSAAGGSTFSTFSSTACTQIAFLNNILYGYQKSTDSFISFDTSGTPTTQFQWKGADGTVASTGNGFVTMFPYGGQMYVVRCSLRVELWTYDGSGMRKLSDLPDDFAIPATSTRVLNNSCCVVDGIVFLAGATKVSTSPTAAWRPQIYYYANGSVGKLWEAPKQTSSNNILVAPLGNGVAFFNRLSQTLMQYDIATGGVHTIANLGITPSLLLTSEISSSIIALISGTSQIYGYSSNYASTGFLQTSQYDFDNTLSKVFRGIKIDADIPANSSIDIAYQIDGAGGSYTSLQTGVTSGTEYFLPANTQGHSISVQVTLNSATGTATPTLKHVYVRGAPILQQFRRREFLFDLSSGTRDEIGQTGRRTRDGFAYSQDAMTACNSLVKVATQTVPFTVYDRFAPGGMTVLADLQQNQAGYDGMAIYEVHPNVFIGRINLREV